MGRAAWKRCGIVLAGLGAVLACYSPTRQAESAPTLRYGGLSFREIPAGHWRLGSAEPGAEAPRSRSLPAFLIATHEVDVASYARYRNACGAGAPHPQLEQRGGTWVARPGWARHPASHLDLAEARAFCRWFGEQHGVAARLPRPDEWEVAARGGLRGGRYPWGWGSPEGRAAFDAEGPFELGRFPANPYGLHDLAGNVYEWCAPEDPDAMEAPARGGSWAERDPDLLRVFHLQDFLRSYRDADLGFRVLIEGR